MFNSTVKASALALLTVFGCLGVQSQVRSQAGGLARPRARWTHASRVESILGGQVRALAARHRRAEGSMRSLLRREQSLWMDPEARLVYHCEAEAPAPAGETAESAAAGPYPSQETFLLHSRPGSPRKIYLDFDGHTTSGTWWNEDTGGAPIVSAPFDTDGSPGFSGAELDAVQHTWQRVAEDYAPFDVDVTTEDPGIEGLRRTSTSDPAFGVRVVISPTDGWFGSAGGVAYLSVFSMINTGSDLPAFVFSANVGNSEKNMAEAASHEAGHTLGLAHDGKSGSAYFTGVSGSDWAPIMGAGYYKNVTQWSRGEYSGANNTEDDYALMQQNGALFRSDDHGSTPATATPLTGTTPSAAGVIEQRSDRDYFRFETGAGSITVAANPGPRGANLDLRLDLFDGNGALIATADPAGLGASLSRSVPAGTYYVSVDGTGVGDPLTTGYSDYGSIGQYTLGASLVAGTAGSLTLTSPNGGETWTAGSGELITWVSSGVTGDVRLEYSTNGGSTWTLITGATPNDGAEPWTVPNSPTTAARVRVSSATGVQDASNASFTIAAAAAPPSITVLSPNGGESWAGGSARVVTWSSTSVSGSVRLEYSLSGGASWSVIAATTANDGQEPWTLPNTPGTALVRVSAVDGSATDTSNSAFTITGTAVDAYEVDDTLSAARPIASGETQDRTIHASGNQDWATFALTAKTRVTLLTAGVSGGDTLLSIYRADGRVVASNDNYVKGGGYSRIADKALGAGTYFVRVTERNGATLSAYTLRLTTRRVARKR